MRDVDAVRAHLGYERLNLWGASYGTRAALEYARQFPSHVRSVVLDGVAPSFVALPDAFAVDTDAALEKWFAQAPGLRADVEALRQSEDSGTRFIDPFFGSTGQLQVTHQQLVSLLRGPLYSPSLAAVLPYAAKRAAQGDFTALLGLGTGLGGNLATGMHFSVLCAEDVPRITDEARRAVDGTFAKQSFIDIYEEACRDWPVRPVPPEVLCAATLRRAGAVALRCARPRNAATTRRTSRRRAAARAPPRRANLEPRRQRDALCQHAHAALHVEGFVRRPRRGLPRRPPHADALRAGGGLAMIRVEHVAKSFEATVSGKKTRVHAVRDVSFEAADGAITALLGPNGAGKTTTLRMLSTLVKPDAGVVTIGEKNVLTQPLDVRADLGVLSDARGLYTRLSAEENIRYYGELRGLGGPALEARIRDLAKLLEFEPLLGRRVEGFSTGEKLKVALARALVHDPKHVLLDEPTNGLDVVSARALRRMLLALKAAGKCIVFSSHVMQEVEALCERVVIVAQGKTIAQGTVAELLAQTAAPSLELAFVTLAFGGEV